MEWELSIARGIDEDVDVILSQTSGCDQNLWHLSKNQDDPEVKHAGDVRDEMEHEHEDKVEPSYLQVYKHKDGSYQDEQMSSTMQEKLAQQHNKSQNSQGSVAWEGLLATSSPVSQSRVQRSAGRVYNSRLSYTEAVKRGVARAKGSLPPSSPREDHRPLCLPATGGIQGPTSKLLKQAKCNHGMSGKRGSIIGDTTVRRRLEAKILSRA
ncbi:hypothetical protein Ancab_006233 [Ancistrocladus abbreviatus]